MYGSFKVKDYYILESRVLRFFRGTLLRTPNREPQEYCRNIMEYNILGVPGLGFPVESLYFSPLQDLECSS